MRLITVAAVLSSLTGFAPASAAFTLELTPAAKNEINVTSDSSGGWTPTPEQRQRVLVTTQKYLEALQSRSAEAYTLLSEGSKQQQTLTQFVQEAEKFKTVAGPVKSWRILKINWTKDSPRAPFPGVYAAIDFSAKFVNVDRNCGYLVLYQKAGDVNFAVMRRENNFLDNANARKIEEQHGKAGVEKVWAALSQHCRNYKPAQDTR